MSTDDYFEGVDDPMAKFAKEFNDAMEWKEKELKKLKAQLEVATKWIERIWAAYSQHPGIVSDCKEALAEMKRLQDDPLKQLVQEAQEMGLYDPPKGEEDVVS